MESEVMGSGALDGAGLPKVSVIVVNYRGAEDTLHCLQALRERLDYPDQLLELVCVDNASGDGSAERIATHAPWARLVRAPTNLGFAGGCNLGVRHSSGPVVALLNPDAVADQGWLRAAVAELLDSPTVGAVASKVLDIDGERVDYVDAGLTWFGMGYKPHAGSAVAALDGQHGEAPMDVLFATGSAMVLRRSVFEALDGFDERFFMFYEDVDLGWRMNLRGWRVRYRPDSLVYHRHHASVSATDTTSGAGETYLLERNALLAMYKNLSAESLAAALPAALALTVRRATARGQLQPASMDPASRGPDSVAVPRTMGVDSATVAGVLAIDQFVDLLPDLAADREHEQAQRVRSDSELRPLMRTAAEPAYPLPRYLQAHDILVQAFDIDATFGTPRRILVITGDALGERMAGPAIRAWHIAALLHREHSVRLVSVNAGSSAPHADFEVCTSSVRGLAEHVAWADVVVAQGHILNMAPALRDADSSTVVVCDMYDPMHLELLEQGTDVAGGDEHGRAAELDGITTVLNDQLRRGDFFLCASQRQRHFWLGHLAALGRIRPRVYDDDPSLRSLVAVAPFGLPEAEPQRSGRPIRESFPAIGPDDPVVLWGGGVYSWFDPLTLLHAVDRLRADRPTVRLVFLGMAHPNPDVPQMGMAARTRALADALGLTGIHVFFNDSWVPYQRRGSWLLDADCGVSTHFEHLEATFAFRTRMLDYLWAGLPVVATRGDSFADLIETQGLGEVVPAEDPHALAHALERVLFAPEHARACRDRIAEQREAFTWERSLAPLLDFCRHPRPAADRLRPAATALTGPRHDGPLPRLRYETGLVREYLELGGPREVARRAAGRLRKYSAGRRFDAGRRSVDDGGAR